MGKGKTSISIGGSVGGDLAGGDITKTVGGDKHVDAPSDAPASPESAATETVFLSYSSKDAAFCTRLRDDLAARGIASFYAPDSLTVGAYTHAALEEAISAREAFVIIVSEASLGSEWVRREVEIALEQELRSAQAKVFPLRIDDTIFSTDVEWGIRLQAGRNIEWFPDPAQIDTMYQRALRRLVEALKT